MSQVSALREHVIHLASESDDEDILIRCIKLLEGTGGPDRAGSGTFSSPMLTSDAASSRAASSVEDDENDVDDAGGPAEQVEGGDGSTRVRRIAVSAPPLMISALKDFVPRVIPKSPEEDEIVRRGVQACHLFATMEADEREVIVNALAKEEFAAGTDILKQGFPPKEKFFMIADGTCQVIKNGKPVASLVSGNTFGELEMMYKTAECAATIRCVTPCVMYALDQQSYQHIVLNVSVEKRKKYEALLLNVQFLQALSNYDRMTIAEALVTTEYQRDEPIISFGEKGQWMHIIVEGEVLVVGRERGKKIDIVRLDAGNVVGELEFLFDHPTVADVVAVSKRVVTAKISKKHFEMVLGSIGDQLKQYVAKNPTYEHYLREANEKVKMEITNLEKRVRRVAKTQGGEMLDKLDKDGEIVLGDPTFDEKESNGKAKPLFRFPLKPVQNSTMIIMIGLREDGTIVMWNDAMHRTTNYTAAEVAGQSIYSFLHSIKDQEAMHEIIQRARNYTGNIDGWYAEQQGKDKYIFTFARSDGLTKAQLQIDIVPPVVAQGKDVADILLAIGQEVKKNGVQKQTDYTHWVTEQVRSTTNQQDIDNDEKLVRISSLMTKFEQLQKGSATSTEDLRVVNVRQLIGQIVMDYGTLCVDNGLAVGQNFEGMYCDEIYCDAQLLPECLRYAMSNCAKHLRDCSIQIALSVEEFFGNEMLQILFHDTGNGFPQKVIDEFNGATSTGNFSQLLRVKAAVEKQGGSMTIASVAGNTQVAFRIPFIPGEDNAGHEDGGNLGGSMALSGAFVKKQTYTTLVVEDTPAHRNMLCAFLWERKHAVLPAYSFGDIQRLANVTDILIVDPQQSVLSDPSSVADPFAMLREKARKMAVIVTGESFDEATKKAYTAAGFLTLQKPCTALQAVQVLRKAEEKISKVKIEEDRIAQTRETLAKNSRGAWKKGQLLGKGAFGEVYEAIDVLTGGKMAVKMLRVSDKMNKSELLNEIEVMCTLQHPNIIHYFYCEDIPDHNLINVFMEYAAGGTVQGLLAKKGKLDFKEYQTLLRDIVEGIAYAHANRFVHCDIKTANVLLNYEGKGKLGDFGTAKRLAEGEVLYTMQGSPLYMSPECMSAGEDKEDGSGAKIGYSFPSDIWSLGCVAMEMATNKPPFSHVEINGPMALMTYITGLTDNPDLSPLFEHPPPVVEFVSACLQPDPAKRPTAAALLGFSIFNETTDDDMKSALKAMKRAQLLHVLNKFVAFQCEEELEQLKKDKEKYKTARRESAFFDSSDEDEGDNDGGEKNFFADSSDDDDEEGDDDEEEKKAGDGTGKKQQSAEATAAPSGDIGGDSSQTSAPVVVGKIANFPKPESVDGSAGTNSNRDTPRTVINNQRRNLFAVDKPIPPPAPPPPAPPQNYPSVTTTPTTAAPPAIDTNNNSKRSNSERHVGFAAPATPPLQPHPPISPKSADTVKVTPPPASTQSEGGPAMAGGAVAATHVDVPRIRSPPPESPHATVSRSVIVLHDALLILIDQLSKLHGTVPFSDALQEQYRLAAAELVQRRKSSLEGSGTNFPDEAAAFVPDVESLLEADALLIRDLTSKLGGGSAAE